MPELKAIGVRIPSDLLALIDDRATEGKTRTDVIIAALKVGLGTESPSEAIEQTDCYTALDNRLTELEALVRQLLDNRITTVKQSLDNRITEPVQRRRTGVKQAIEGEPPQCPKCESDATRWEGYGKLRADGTRSKRIKCRSCGKTSMIS